MKDYEITFTNEPVSKQPNDVDGFIFNGWFPIQQFISFYLFNALIKHKITQNT